MILGRNTIRTAFVMAAMAPIACAEPCDDDGLRQQKCEVPADGGASASQGTDGTDSATASASASASGTQTDTAESASMSGTGHGETETESASESITDSATATDTDGVSASATDTDGVSASVTDTDSASASATDTDGVSASVTDTDGASASATDTDGASASVTDTDGASAGDGSSTGGPSIWCYDGDGDGFGAPGTELETDDPPEGYVDNCDDCDDTNPYAYPGAAPLDDPEACMLDMDGDGYGAANPGPGITPGTDCWDFNSSLHPDAVTLAYIAEALGGGDAVRSIDRTDASIQTMAPLDTVLTAFTANSVTLAPNGTIYANNQTENRLYTVDYELVCLGTATLGEITPRPNPHGIDGLCAIAMGPGAQLRGIDAINDTIVQLDPATGEAGAALPLTLEGEPLDVFACGMAFDCHEQRLLLANGLDGNIYELDHLTGEATLIAQTGLNVDPTGLEYDPTVKACYMSSDQTLSRVELDGSDDVETIGTMTMGVAGPQTVSHMNMLPVCNP